jgi:hypothetical protein
MAFSFAKRGADQPVTDCFPHVIENWDGLFLRLLEHFDYAAQAAAIAGYPH